jgi:MoaA/NifB/PqqE/SkfB family radical SAM enzyme
MINLTKKCNFNCAYCGAYREGNISSMTAKQAIEIISKQPFLKRVKLSGGEVLLNYDDCIEIIKYCHSRGITTQINTNGSLLDQNKIRELYEAGLNTLHFSFNFTNADDFSKYYKQKPELFQTIVNNILNALQFDWEVVTEIIIIPETLRNITALQDYLYSLGVRKIEIQCGMPNQNWLIDNSVSPLQICNAIVALIKNNKTGCDLFFSCVMAHIEPGTELYQQISEYFHSQNVHFGKCIDGKKQLEIHSNGDVIICALGYPIVIANAFDKPENLSLLITNPPPVLEEFQALHGCRRKIFRKAA